MVNVNARICGATYDGHWNAHFTAARLATKVSFCTGQSDTAQKAFAGAEAHAGVARNGFRSGGLDADAGFHPGMSDAITAAGAKIAL